jgi:hypothetical protein
MINVFISHTLFITDSGASLTLCKNCCKVSTAFTASQYIGTGTLSSLVSFVSFTSELSSHSSSMLIKPQVKTLNEDSGVLAEWHFFATSHGKSACDGVGGTLRRLAPKASLQ